MGDLCSGKRTIDSDDVTDVLTRFGLISHHDCLLDRDVKSPRIF